eukprot:TRINITY_DN6613_c0_g4_i1.p1 TRINITY_DN6613_c0_g4~~TRINITY_DN6613_c0_g4_i1.p1  ORF type:complete len:317 (-),score=29.86 TRINITY_DN6613_c0_g4_i1:631-1581(-)
MSKFQHNSIYPRQQQQSFPDTKQKTPVPHKIRFGYLNNTQYLHCHQNSSVSTEHTLCASYKRSSLNPSVQIFGIFYGTSKLCANIVQLFPDELKAIDVQNNPQNALSFKICVQEAITKLDQKLLGKKQCMSFGGCVGCVMVEWRGMVFVANLGNCRAVLVDKEGVQQLSYEHTLEQEVERYRVIYAGGQILNFKGREVIACPKTKGGIQYSRGFGHYVLKDPKYAPRDQIISSIPDVRIVRAKIESQYMVIACPNFWKNANNANVANIMQTQLSKQKRKKLNQQLGDRLLNLCDQNNSANLLVIKIKKKQGILGLL